MVSSSSLDTPKTFGGKGRHDGLKIHFLFNKSVGSSPITFKYLNLFLLNKKFKIKI